MKFKATKKQMRNGYNKIISVGYCEAWYLLRGIDPIAYSAGENGWACDHYDVDGVLISEGYAPLANKNTAVDHNTIRWYNESAKDIIFEHSNNYDKQCELIRDLRARFIAEVSV